MKKYSHKKNGFTLIETMLVLVIMITVAIMALKMMQSKSKDMRIDRTAQQIQQIMQAAVAYYVDNGKWPGYGATTPENFNEEGISDLINSHYLPLQSEDNTAFLNSWGNAYQTALLPTLNANGNNASNLFLISTNVGEPGYASMLKGILPLSRISSDDDSTVIVSINVPAYNYNNAESVKNAGIYDYGDCVPVPSCPDDMEPKVIMAPAGVVGLSSTSNTTSHNLQSFLAIAYTDPASNKPSTTPALCYGMSGSNVCSDPNNTSTAFWRACLEGTTDQGTDISNFKDPNDPNAKSSIQIMVMTHCAYPASTLNEQYTTF